MMFDIDIIIAKLLTRFDSFGKIIASVKIVEDYNIETANTDGKTIRYNPNFMGNITPDEGVFVLAHEVLHIDLDQIRRSIGKDPRIWNIASDAINNAYLAKAGLPILDGAIDIPEAIDFDCEELYDLIKSIQEEMEEEQSNNGKSNSEGNNSNSSDSEGNNTKESDNEGDNHEKNLEEKIRDLLSSIPEESTSYGVDSHDGWKEAARESGQTETPIKKISEKEYFAELDEENRESEEQYVKQLFNQAMSDNVNGYGNGSLGFVREVEKNYGYGHLIPWQDLLKEALQVEERYSRRFPRVRYGAFKYRMREEPINEAEILLDTSASISDELLKNFLLECKSLIRDSSKVKVGCFDVDFYGFTEIKSVKEIDSLEFKGGGGTDFNAAVNAFTSEATHKIIFTDGRAPMPDKRVDAIWVVIGDKKINPPGGRVIYISKEEFEKLNRPKRRLNLDEYTP